MYLRFFLKNQKKEAQQKSMNAKKSESTGQLSLSLQSALNKDHSSKSVLEISTPNNKGILLFSIHCFSGQEFRKSLQSRQASR